MSTIGSIVVNLVANTSAFISAMNTSEGVLKKFAVVGKATAAALAPVTAAFVAFQSVKSVIGGINEGIDKLAKINGVAKTVGMTAEQLQRFQYAAKQSGIDVDTFSESLKQIGLNISAAAAKGGRAERVFQQLGISARSLSGKDTATQLLTVLSATEKIGNQATRRQILRDITGSDDIAKLKNLNALMAEAGVRGRVMSNALVAGAAGYKKALADLKDAVSTVFMRLGGLLAPLLRVFATVVTGIFDQINGYLASNEGTLVEGLKGWLDNIQGFLVDLYNVMADVGNKIIEFINKANALAGRAGKLAAVGDVFSGGLVSAVAPEITDMAGGKPIEFRFSKMKVDKKWSEWLKPPEIEKPTQEVEQTRKILDLMDAIDKKQDAIKKNAGNPALEAWVEAKETYDKVTALTDKQQTIQAVMDKFFSYKAEEQQAKIQEVFTTLGNEIQGLQIQAAYWTQSQNVKTLLERGANQEQVRALLGLEQQQKAWEKLISKQQEYKQKLEGWVEDLPNRGRKAWEDTLTPMEQYSRELENISNLYATHAIGDQTANRMLGKAYEQYKPEPKLARYAESGSVEEYKMLMEFQLRAQKQGTKDELVKQQTDHLKKMREWFDQLDPALMQQALANMAASEMFTIPN